jgi:N-glycosylase/DNA lyase
MRSVFIRGTRGRLESTVRVLCPIIEHQVRANTAFSCTEYALRRELVGCILGSQVRHRTAIVALERIERMGLLDDGWWRSTEDTFESHLFDVLSGRAPQCDGNRCYRFPKTRAHQLARARDAVAKRCLSERLSDTCDPKQMRQRLVAEISGLGPKQASMFLRNIGKSYDLAILDTHVLRFMDMQNLLCLEHRNIGTVPAYERTERIVVDYADALGYPVGYLDWAIWVTMRAARELGL